jgi:methionyl-tRNA synthetase
MAKRKKASKVQKRAKLRGSTKRGKARKAAKAAKAPKRTVAKAKPKAPVKKAVRKVKQPATPVVETVAAEVIERPVGPTDEASSAPAV